MAEAVGVTLPVEDGLPAGLRAHDCSGENREACAWWRWTTWARLAGALAGVRRTAPRELAEWRYHGRLVARQLDDAHLVIRADFDYRDSLLREFPGTFSVPARYARHMMVVADLASGDAGAIEDALEAAWQLQRSAG